MGMRDRRHTVPSNARAIMVRADKRPLEIADTQSNTITATVVAASMLVSSRVGNSPYVDQPDCSVKQQLTFFSARKRAGAATIEVRGVVY